MKEKTYFQRGHQQLVDFQHVIVAGDDVDQQLWVPRTELHSQTGIALDWWVLEIDRNRVTADGKSHHEEVLEIALAVDTVDGRLKTVHTQRLE